MSREERLLELADVMAKTAFDVYIGITNIEVLREVVIAYQELRNGK